MDLKNFKSKLIGDKDERAVSPVIGVILMVAITVILAAVIAAFVLDIGDLDDSAPNAQFDWDSSSDNDKVNVSHTSGDDIDLGDISVTVETNAENGNTGTSDFESADFTAGDEIKFEIEGENVETDEYILDDNNLNEIADGEEDDEIVEVTLTWESDGTSTIITEHEP